MNILEFLQYVKNHESEFIRYCEVIIDKLGRVHLAVPCHVETAIRIASEKNKMSVIDYKNEIPVLCSPLHWTLSKDNMVAVWYNYVIRPVKLTRFQIRTLGLLDEYGIISEVCNITITNEYMNYMYMVSEMEGCDK